MHVLVTVGSTQFDELVQSVISADVLESLATAGYTSLCIQAGNSSIPKDFIQDQRLDIQIWTFKPSMSEEYQRADLIISHAGAGTILEVLRIGKRLVVVPNSTLADNHQLDLSSTLADLNHLVLSTSKDLAQNIISIRSRTFTPFPAQVPKRFADILDSEMGFI